MNIRGAVASDVPAIERCVVAAYEGYVGVIGRPPAPMTDDYVELVDREVCFVAESVSGVVGVIVMWPETDHLYIDNIAIDPRMQGSGIGTRLLAFADGHARRGGMLEVRLYTNEAMTANLDYYPRRGFVETHRATDRGYRRVYFRRVLDGT